MEDSSELNSAKYLRQHLETLNEVNADSVIPLLFKPQKEVDYLTQGKVEYNIGDVRVNFSYESAGKLPFRFRNFVTEAAGQDKNIRILTSLTL